MQNKRPAMVSAEDEAGCDGGATTTRKGGATTTPCQGRGSRPGGGTTAGCRTPGGGATTRIDEGGAEQELLLCELRT